MPVTSWGCRTHWFALPREVREPVWQLLQEGGRFVQGADGADRLHAANQKVLGWIQENRCKYFVGEARDYLDARCKRYLFVVMKKEKSGTFIVKHDVLTKPVEIDVANRICDLLNLHS